MTLLKLDERDNVATAVDDIARGQSTSLGPSTLLANDDIPRGHKVALRDIPVGTDVIRYGEVIGAATADIVRGDHVHVHNVVSKRIPG